MVKNQKLSVFFGGLVLLACGVTSAHAQPAPRSGAATTRAGGEYVVTPAEKPVTKPADANAGAATTRPGGDYEAKRAANIRPNLHELRCRGGENAFQLALRGFSPRRNDTTRGIFYDLDFRASTGPARDDGSGLEEGTCSWIDRALSGAEPRRIFFDAAPVLREIGAARERDTDTPLIKYFNDQNHSWSFFVYNTGDGFLLSMREKVLFDDRQLEGERLRRP